MISMKYAYLMNTVFHSSFYAALIPAGIIISIISLIIVYWVYKYNILNRCTYHYELGD
jgi:di/tricarboxylate transporter